MTDLVGPKTPGASNFKLTIEYDGAGFHGWQRQPDQRTVQGEMEEAAKILFGHAVTVRASGRTDAGVHAFAQVANVHTTRSLPAGRILRGFNGLCGKDVRVLAIEEVPVDWEARHRARGKWYRYRLLPRFEDTALEQGRVWRVHPKLDLDVLNRELATLPGTARWGAYRAADCSSPDPVKTILDAHAVREDRGVIAVRIHGSGFLKQMVRILVGTAVEVGVGRMPEGSMIRIRETQERVNAGPTAPSHGLFLERVLYDPIERSD